MPSSMQLFIPLQQSIKYNTVTWHRRSKKYYKYLEIQVKKQLSTLKQS